MTERLVTSATGGKKGAKPAQLAGVDPKSLLILAEVSGRGAEKYGDPFNYLKGYDWSLSFNALQRHALAFWGGEDNDPESGLPHMGHAAWHALALVSFLTRGLGTDDRFKQEPSDYDEVVPPGLQALVDSLRRPVRPEVLDGTFVQAMNPNSFVTTKDNEIVPPKAPEPQAYRVVNRSVHHFPVGTIVYRIADEAPDAEFVAVAVDPGMRVTDTWWPNGPGRNDMPSIQTVKVGDLEPLTP